MTATTGVSRRTTDSGRREQHDGMHICHVQMSRTIGYSPDFVVGVWVGNAQDRAMNKISGQTGAGKIWLVIAGAPASLLVTVEHDGWVIGERVLVPEYEENAPNGDDCPPVCYVGEDSMAVESW